MEQICSDCGSKFTNNPSIVLRENYYSKSYRKAQKISVIICSSCAAKDNSSVSLVELNLTNAIDTMKKVTEILDVELEKAKNQKDKGGKYQIPSEVITAYEKAENKLKCAMDDTKRLLNITK